MTKFLAICQNTFIQALRQPVFCVLLLVTFSTLVLSVPLTNWAISVDYHDTNQKMLESLGLSTLLMMGLLAAAFSASGALSREIEDKTAMTVMSKPVSRATFVLGKFAGVSAAVALFYFLGSIIFLMTIRHKVMPAASDPIDWPVIVLGCSSVALAVIIAMAGNLMFAWTFTSTAVFAATVCMTVAMATVTFIGKGWRIIPFGQDIRVEILYGLVLIFMAVLVFVAVAIAASTRFGQVMTLLICCGVFFVGSIHQFMFGYWNDRIVLARPLGWMCPHLDYFYPLDALAMGKDPSAMIPLAGGYCACFVAGVLALGIAMFQRRQLDGQETSASMPGMVSLLAWIGRIIAIVLALAGAEAVLSFVATKWSPTFQPIMLQAMKGEFFSQTSSDAMGLIPAGGFVIAGVLGWILWGFFGRGVKWSYWLVLTLAVFTLAYTQACISGLLKVSQAGLYEPALLAIEAILAAGIIVIMILPKTRRHFRS